MGMIDTLNKTPLPKKIALLVLILLVLGGGFWFIYYQPVLDELDSLQTTEKRLGKKLADAERRKKTYDDDRARRDELKKASGLQLQVLPPQTEIASFLNSLNTQADLVGLEILSVKPLEEKPAQYYARIPVRLKLRGSFHQLAKFFFLVGSVDRIINIENIQFKNSVIDDSGASMTAEVLATTFRSVSPRAKGKGRGKKKGKG
jgi:type IV pilus assembly protein PilO